MTQNYRILLHGNKHWILYVQDRVFNKTYALKALNICDSHFSIDEFSKKCKQKEAQQDLKKTYAEIYDATTQRTIYHFYEWMHKLGARSSVSHMETTLQAEYIEHGLMLYNDMYKITMYNDGTIDYDTYHDMRPSYNMSFYLAWHPVILYFQSLAPEVLELYISLQPNGVFSLHEALALSSYEVTAEEIPLLC